MAELPPAMLTGKRKADQEFDEREELFRAFDPESLEGDTVAIDAIELPDMSVNRGKYGPAEWILLLDCFHGCGVAVFKVADIPKELLNKGIFRLTFSVSHEPTQNNYPHSVVQGYDENNTHIDAKEVLDPDVHLRWRNRLRQRIKIRIPPPSQMSK